MTVAGDVVAALQTFIQHLEEAGTAASSASDEADKGRDMSAALGHSGSVEAFSAIHDLIEQAHQMLGPVIDKANEAKEQAQAIESG